ncbi:MAG: hypothetical protein KGY65_03695 [Candidatus Thermoplasmatota archaeon]|nr:hypothetical protein [Candidatus Thermoplasmatota archaeon]MBS3801833.1 hypothetical protein [Candidatus Thermoplasmatota archaeon]
MRRKLFCIFTCTILASTIIPVVIEANYINTPLDGGWIEEIDGVTILHVSGSYYEMGYQHGYLLKEEIQENLRAFLSLYDQQGWTYDDVLDVWNVQKYHIPKVYDQEIQGMADGADLSYEDIAVLNTWMGVFNHLFSCWGASLWGGATATGRLLHMRSVDGMNQVKDIKTDTFLYENQVIIIRNPDDAYASIAPIFSGDIVVIGGFNENSVGVSELTIIGDDTTFNGINAGYRMRMVLDFADNGFEAVDIMNSNRTCCWNFIVSDGDIPIGFALEQSANFAYTNTWYDAVESTEPFWEIKHVVRRGNCYINPMMAELQRTYYDPSGLNGYLRMILRIEFTYINWIQYKGISEEIEEQYGTLRSGSALMLLRDVYLGKTNLMFRLLFTNTSDTARQWVGCLETGDLSICFAQEGEEAYHNDVHTFNFYDLLNKNPP